MTDLQMDLLEKAVAPERINVDYFERLMHSHDLAPVPSAVAANYKNMPSAVVKPKTTEELEKLVKAAIKMNTCLIPKGRGTSYLWGSVPVVGGIVVEMTEMREIDGFSAEELWIEAGAGATWQQLEEYLQKRGHTLRAYPTSMPSATVGGWISSSGSGLGSGGDGVGSLMYGSVGNNIAALQVVTGNSETLNLESEKSVAEFVGTDGITGFVTKAKVKIRKIPESSRQLLVSCKGTEELQNLIIILGGMETAYHAQFEDSSLIDCKLSVGLHSPKIENGFLLFAEFEGSSRETTQDAETVKEAAKKLGGDVFPEKDAAEEWRLRCYPMKVKRSGPSVIAGEFIVPSSRLAPVLSDVSTEMPNGNSRHGVHGVLAHPPDVIVLPQIFTDERKGFGFLAALSYSKRFNDIAPRHGGKPYGAGHFNSFNAKLVHGEDGLKRLKELKKKHDPNNVINPGKGIEHKTRFGFSVPPFLFNLSMFSLGLFRRAGL